MRCVPWGSPQPFSDPAGCVVLMEEAIMARKFFYVCAGLSLLAYSFHLGATSAHGQVGGIQIFVEGVNGGVPYVVTASGDQLRYVPGYGWLSDAGNIFGTASGGRTVASLVPQVALTSTGEVWYGQGIGSAPWVNAGAPPLGPTPVHSTTFGALKARYR